MPDGYLVVEVPKENSLASSRYTYARYSPEAIQEQDMRSAEGGADYGKRLRDIILVGEGHSSWGEFKLAGRVRRCDGFITINKVYVSVLPPICTSFSIAILNP